MDIFLRAFEPDDHILINRWRNDPEIMEMTQSTTGFVSSAMEKRWVEEQMLNNRNNLYLAICLSDSGEMVGYLSLRDIDHQSMRAECSGIVIGRKDLWQKGIAAKAMRMLLDHAFDMLNLNLLFLFALEGNTGSLQLARSIGFRDTGFLPQYQYKAGKMHSVVILALLREDYRESSSGLRKADP